MAKKKSTDAEVEAKASAKAEEKVVNDGDSSKNPEESNGDNSDSGKADKDVLEGDEGSEGSEEETEQDKILVPEGIQVKIVRGSYGKHLPGEVIGVDEKELVQIKKNRILEVELIK